MCEWVTIKNGRHLLLENGHQDLVRNSVVSQHDSNGILARFHETLMCPIEVQIVWRRVVPVDAFVGHERFKFILVDSGQSVGQFPIGAFQIAAVIGVDFLWFSSCCHEATV